MRKEAALLLAVLAGMSCSPGSHHTAHCCALCMPRDSHHTTHCCALCMPRAMEHPGALSHILWFGLQTIERYEV